MRFRVLRLYARREPSNLVLRDTRFSLPSLRERVIFDVLSLESQAGRLAYIWREINLYRFRLRVLVVLRFQSLIKDALLPNVYKLRTYHVTKIYHVIKQKINTFSLQMTLQVTSKSEMHDFLQVRLSKLDRRGEGKKTAATETHMCI